MLRQGSKRRGLSQGGAAGTRLRRDGDVCPSGGEHGGHSKARHPHGARLEPLPLGEVAQGSGRSRLQNPLVRDELSSSAYKVFLLRTCRGRA